ncbi:hypothetical protein QAD02_009761 [Eretmocerus hayati]|uniref:Uncharacterized protein n=1 Tax=Eretmocerus hayati TaxID=131215 RepID=A0ACC2NAY6_9HYME|nr:hypothetical protein QAD02_009761 [Eretmocerus hayati]
MFPHNSSSHEISTETNAFVQNSKGNVVVLEESSLSGVEERNGPEDAGYCDIKFINSRAMAAPTSHPEATAANDSSTVLSRHSDELSSASVISNRWLQPSVAASTSKSSSSAAASDVNSIAMSIHDITNKLEDNKNNIIKNHSHELNKIKMNNTSKNEKVCEKLLRIKLKMSSPTVTVIKLLLSKGRRRCCCRLGKAWLALPSRRPASQALKSKSTSKLLSDNKDSFSSNNNNSKSVISLSSLGAASLQQLIQIQIEFDNGEDAASTSARRINASIGVASSSITLNNVPNRRELATANEPELQRRLISALCVPLKIGESNALLALSSAPASERPIDGISCTEATMCTIGALSFLDNNKSNEPLNASFKMSFAPEIDEEESALVGSEQIVDTAESTRRDSNLILKESLSKSTPSVKSSDKSDTDVVTMIKDSYKEYNTTKSRGASSPLKIVKQQVIESFNDQDEVGHSWPILNIPTAKTTCDEPTMTLTSQTNDVPAEPRLTNAHDYDLEQEGEKNEKARISLVKDCKGLLADYWNTRDKRFLTRLREALNTLLNYRDYSAFATTTTTTFATKPVNCKLESSTDDLILGYKQRWGIAGISCLAGGGESSLNNSAAANWASAQPTSPNNNNQAQSGWSSGTGAVLFDDLQRSNPQTGPPTSQPNQIDVANPVGGGQWAQVGNKTAGSPGNPNNPQVQNNNAGQVPNQQQPQPQPPQPNQQQQPGQPQPGQQVPPGPPGNNNPQPNNGGQPNAVATPVTSSTKQQLEQLNTMKEALFSTDGWGCQHVNQDTNWDVPTSPEPPNMNKDGVPLWKPPVNNGTDLWEANLRNGGQPPPQQQAKAPWGHTPSTNIGGTWGEDDDTADTSNMWTGAPTPNQPNNAPWPNNSANQTGMWTGGNGGGASTGGGSNWGDPRVDPRDPREMRSVDPREMRGADPREHRMSLDPRDQHVRVMDPMSRDPRMSGEMRGDPRGGISGRLNGTSADAMWNLPPGPPHHQMPGHQIPSGPPAKILGPSNMNTNMWTAPPPKEMMPGKPSGWEEPSPPPQRRNVPSYDDGTSLWGNPAANQRPMQGKVSHWKDGPSQNLGRGGMQCPPGMMGNQMPGQGMKPDSVTGGNGGGPMWGSHPNSGGPAGGGHNGSWGDGPPDGPGWGDKSRNRRYPAMSDIVDPRAGKAVWEEHQKPPSMGPTGNWGDTDMDPTSSWGHTPKQPLTKELIWSSREFRYLCDMGFKKEDVEVALRSREMNRDEAQELLSQLRPVDQWRRHDGGHSGYDLIHSAAGQPFPRLPPVSQQMSFPPTSRTPQSQPSTQQLRMLVQQIQLAVQEGYLNHQILNQPLAPQTLILLNQLLQQIKVLQQLHQQHTMQSSLKGNSQTVLQISVQITKTKQQIANLQNQIAVQQATYMKQQQQQQQQQHPSTPSQPDYYKPSVHDPMSALQNSFSDLAMNKDHSMVLADLHAQSQQQSRLNQWKLPSLDKDVDSVVNEFSRAPGSTSSKPPTTPGGLGQSHSSPNMNPLLGPSDATWSSRLGDSGWPDAGNNDSTDGKEWQPPGAGAAFADLVPEFEPGKPWKIKSIEDDPSITPGSVVRSPLSLAAIKDTDTIFSTGSKTSPPPQSVTDSASIPSLSNSTWSFNPPATTPSVFSRGPDQSEENDHPDLFYSSKNTWGDTAPPPTAVTSELWGAPMGKSNRGPPPGLGSKGNSSIANPSNGWGGLTPGRSSTWGLQGNAAPGAGAGGGGGGGGGGNPGWVSPCTWLLLRNLTPQIDGSTLKTLCMQHGPVQDFRLYLNHGIALAKYSSRDEAIKAQGALNNCVLGNTTIFAESPVDSEVHTLLQQLSHGSGAGGGAGAAPGAQQQSVGSGGAGWGGLRPAVTKTGPPPTNDTWGGGASQLWGGPPTTNSLWSSSLDSSDQQRATPSSLNSYLPGDLLGGESM